MNLDAKRFRVKNYRNIDDSGWIPLERVTALVGRNEAGKTTLLKALHKFHPAIEEPYDAQREFPRDRFTAEYRNGADWPVCLVEFELSEPFRKELEAKLNSSDIPKTATFTRYYDGHCDIEYDTEITDDPVASAELVATLDEFAKGARRIAAPDPDQEEATQVLRTTLANWADEKKSLVAELQDLRTERGVELISLVQQEVNDYAQPLSAGLVESLLGVVNGILRRAQTAPLSQQIDEAVAAELPVFIYFENYGILDSAVYLPRFLDDLGKTPDNPRVRTINAIFKHVRLEASEIADLGREEAQEAHMQGQSVTDEIIQRDRARKDLRNVKLNSAGGIYRRNSTSGSASVGTRSDIRLTAIIFAFGYPMIVAPMWISNWKVGARVSSGFSRSIWYFLSNRTRDTRMPCCCSMNRGCICIRPHSRNCSSFLKGVYTLRG